MKRNYVFTVHIPRLPIGRPATAAEANMPIPLRTLSAPLVPLILFAGLATNAPHTPPRVEARAAASTSTTTAPLSGDLTLTVVVTGADRPVGVLGAAVFSSADGFPNQPAKSAKFSMRPRTAPVDSFVFQGLTPGRYAVSVFHDQNSNSKLDANLFGVPKEPWGTTGSVRPRMRAPRFDEAMINVTTDTRVEIRVES
jgi:uncharacterized protein (DUF2141 family)